MIAEATTQADRVIVVLEEEYAFENMKGAAENRFRLFPELEEIIFVTKDGEFYEFINNKGRKK